MYKLVIVESPAKCKKIEEYLGSGYKCVASFGHLTTLRDLESIDIKNHYRANYTIIEGKHKFIKSIQTAINKAQEVLLASDDDREGEAIAWHLCSLFNLDINNTKRLIFHEITKSAVRSALANPSKINMNLVNAQKTRQILDIFVGFHFSPLLWKHISPVYKQGLSAGRCQTPTLRLIYDNEREIYYNKPEKVTQFWGFFTKHNVKFSLNQNIMDAKDVSDFLNLSLDHTYFLNISNESDSVLPPPSPLTTNILQQKMTSLLNSSPKDIMKYAQTLYEQGYITYMRTDCKNYSADFIHECKNYISDVFDEAYFANDTRLVSKSKNAHEAIRPTDIRVIPGFLVTNSDLSPKHRKLYDFIWKTSLQSLMTPAKQRNFFVTIPAPMNYTYQHKCTKTVFKGWTIVDNLEDNTLYEYFKMLDTTKPIKYNQIKAHENILKTKSHLSYSNLLKLLEEKNIGRPSTYASIIDKNISRGYIQVKDVVGDKYLLNHYNICDGIISTSVNDTIIGNEKNKLLLQPLGFMVIEFLSQHFSNFFDYEFTAHLESVLDNISDGSTDNLEVCDKYYKEILSCIDIANIPKKLKLSYPIDTQHSLIVAKYGAVIEGDQKAFFKVKDNLSPFKLKDQQYLIDDVIESKMTNNLLGKYKEENLYVKDGKYGTYLTWGKNTKSLKGFDGDPYNCDLKNIIKFIEQKESNTNIIRVITENISIRSGKYGLYVFHKTEVMKKPKFYKFHGFPQLDKIDTCDKDIILAWIKKNYDIQ